MTADDLLDEALAPAAALVCAVREDPTEVHSILLDRTTIEQLHALAVVLACMVPDDKPLTDLLAWTREPAPTVWDEPRRREAHRLYAAGRRDARTVEGERAYQRARKRPRKRAA